MSAVTADDVLGLDATREAPDVLFLFLDLPLPLLLRRARAPGRRPEPYARAGRERTQSWQFEAWEESGHQTPDPRRVGRA